MARRKRSRRSHADANYRRFVRDSGAGVLDLPRRGGPPRPSLSIDNDAAEVAARLRQQEAELDAKLAAAKRRWSPPKDKGFKPTRQDPLRVGPARVTPATADAAARAKATTRHEYEQRNRKAG